MGLQQLLQGAGGSCGHAGGQQGARSQCGTVTMKGRLNMVGWWLSLMMWRLALVTCRLILMTWHLVRVTWRLTLVT